MSHMEKRDKREREQSGIYVKKPMKPSMNRRASFHDYRRRGKYMFTLQRHPDAPALSVITGNPRALNAEDEPCVLLSPIGAILDDELHKTTEMRPHQLAIITYVIMPDHVHLLLRLKEDLTFPITKIVSAIESATTRRSRESGLIDNQAAIFCGEGMNDRIVFDDRQQEILVRYISDNPRRLLIKRMMPDLFRRRLSVRIGNDVVDCVGNIFLLRKPMMAVHVRRRWSAAETEQYKALCIASAENGMVLISPFISPVENEIRKEVLANGGSIIQIMDHGFAARFKPSGKSMDTCAEGRLLLISEAGASVRAEDMSYKKASRLNQLAERIAALPTATAVRLKGSGKDGE